MKQRYLTLTLGASLAWAAVSCTQVGNWDAFAIQAAQKKGRDVYYPTPSLTPQSVYNPPAQAASPRIIVMPKPQKVSCSQCHGTGVEASVDMTSHVPGTQTCTRCNGQGYFTTY